MNWFKRWLWEWRCEHFWRPALAYQFGGLNANVPAKVCDYCGKVVRLSDEQFYAQFGHMPWTAQIKKSH